MNGERAGRRAGDHGAFDELAVGWALHALEPEDEAVFAMHLPDCARCARTVAETSDVMGALATDLPPAEPSPELRDRLRAAVERTEQAPPIEPEETPELDELEELEEQVRAVGPVPPRGATGFPHYQHGGGAPVPPPGWRRLLPPVLIAVVVAALLGLGTWIVLLGEARTQAEAAAAEQAQIMASLLRPGQATIAPLSDDGGHMVATVVARQGQVQVVTNGLAVNDATRSVYVIWGMQGGATTVALGTFDVVRPQTDLRTVGSDQTGLDGYPAYAISIEQGRQAPSTPSVVVAKGQVTS